MPIAAMLPLLAGVSILLVFVVEGGQLELNNFTLCAPCLSKRMLVPVDPDRITLSCLTSAPHIW